METIKTIAHIVVLIAVLVVAFLAFKSWKSDTQEIDPLQIADRLRMLKETPKKTPNETPKETPKDTPTLTVFSAKWCSACQHAKPTINKIEQSGVKVTRIDADEQPQLLRENNVNLLPTFIAIKDGKTLRTQDVNAVLEFLCL